MCEDVSQRLAPPEHRGLAFAGLHGFRQQAGPLDVQADGLVAEAFEHPVDTRSLRLRGITDQPGGLPLLDALLMGR